MMLMSEFARQVDKAIRNDLAAVRAVRFRFWAAVAVAALAAGVAVGTTGGIAAAFGLAATACAGGALFLRRLLRRKSQEINIRLTSLAALRGMARDAGASSDEIGAIDRLYRALNSAEAISIVRGRGSLI
jgi:hypothetical protein